MFLFLCGAIMIASLTASLFFFKFWRRTHERLFGWFALAFFVFGLERLASAIIDTQDEIRTWLYIARLACFILIIFAIIQKNTESKLRTGETHER